MSTFGPRRALAVMPLVLALPLLAACGSSPQTDVKPGNADASAPSSTASSASATPTPTTSTSPGGPQVFTSDLEAKAPVKVARAWAAAVADEINAQSQDHAPTRSLSTARGQRSLPALYEDEYNLRYPGPLPLRPLRLSVLGRSATLAACVMKSGWGVARSSGAVVSSQEYGEFSFVLRRQAGVWKMDKVDDTEATCSGTGVKGSS